MSGVRLAFSKTRSAFAINKGEKYVYYIFYKTLFPRVVPVIDKAHSKRIKNSPTPNRWSLAATISAPATVSTPCRTAIKN